MPPRQPQRQVSADSYRQQQAKLNAATTAAVLALWLKGWSPDRPDLWPGLKTLLRTLVLQRRAAAARLAVASYRRSRQAAGVGGLFVPSSADPPPVELVDATADIMGPGSYRRALKAGKSPEQARRSAGVQLSGAATRLVTNGGRETTVEAVRDDPKAIGWARVSDGDPCSWCAVMISRGAVYKTAGTAGQDKNDRFIGHGQFKWHSHCGCSAIPIWSRDDPHLETAADLYDLWKQHTVGYSGNDALNAFRRYWENRDKPKEAVGDGAA